LSRILSLVHDEASTVDRPWTRIAEDKLAKNSCFICGETGHQVAGCPQRKEDPNKPTKPGKRNKADKEDGEDADGDEDEDNDDQDGSDDERGGRGGRERGSRGGAGRNEPKAPGRGLHSFPFPLKFSLLRPIPLNLSLICPPYVSRRYSS